MGGGKIGIQGQKIRSPERRSGDQGSRQGLRELSALAAKAETLMTQLKFSQKAVAKKFIRKTRGAWLMQRAKHKLVTKAENKRLERSL